MIQEVGCWNKIVTVVWRVVDRLARKSRHEYGTSPHDVEDNYSLAHFEEDCKVICRNLYYNPQFWGSAPPDTIAPATNY